MANSHKIVRKQPELQGGWQSPPAYETRSIRTPSSTYEQKERITQGGDDERDWQLDEAQDELARDAEPQRKSKRGAANPDKVIAAFLSRHPLATPSSSYNTAITTPQGGKYKLEFPVVIPQRRPHSKKRGFIRAYAPDLANMGIDQATWLDFIDTFNEASLANPWIDAINLAALATNATPSVIGFAVSMGVLITTNIAIEMQIRYRYFPAPSVCE